MAQMRPKNQGHAVAFAAAALICQLLTQRLVTRQTELLSEALAWIALPFLVRTMRPRYPDEIAPPVAASKGASSSGIFGSAIFAAGIAVASFCRAENGTSRFYPVLVPLLLVAQRSMQQDRTDSARGNLWAVPHLFTSLRGTSATAAIAVLDLFICNLEKTIYATVALISTALAYVTLLPQRRRKSELVPSVRIEEDIDQLSRYAVIAVAIVFVIQTLVFDFTTGGLIGILVAAVLKSLTWLFMIQLTRNTPWNVLPSMGVFTLMAGQSPFFQTSAWRPLLHIAVSWLSLGQVISAIPNRTKSRTVLWMFMLVTIIPYGANNLAIRRAENAAKRTFGGTREHPVDILMRGAKAQFSGLIHRQSKTLQEAKDEYRLRYKMEPPPGFEAWYKFAVANESPIIDEFDLIHKQVAPFLKLSGAEIQTIMDRTYIDGASEVWSCHYNRNEAKARCEHPYRSFDRHISTLFETVGKFAGAELPDIRFLVNHLDEPMVLLPSTTTTRVNVTDMSRLPIWPTITKECAAHQVEISQNKDERDSYSLPFIKDAASAMDICRHPEYENMHGMFISPVSFRLVNGLVPILSTGAPSTMGDILMPSPAYIESEFVYDSEQEPEFYEKTNSVYWAGSTSGAFADSERWRDFHRQRFVQFAQNLGREQYYYLEEKDDTVERVPSSFLNGRLFDVAFTRIFQCQSKECREQKAFFPPGAWADKDAALKSRLVFDLDGNGISGRYYKLLASKSLPLKQTLIREWHDERLIPWLHYVPVSQSLEELPELVMYLTSTEAGQNKAKEMADKGREWYGKAMRKVDMSIYIYRLMLELARLQDPKRLAEK